MYTKAKRIHSFHFTRLLFGFFFHIFRFLEQKLVCWMVVRNKIHDNRMNTCCTDTDLKEQKMKNTKNKKNLCV